MLKFIISSFWKAEISSFHHDFILLKACWNFIISSWNFIISSLKLSESSENSSWNFIISSLKLSESSSFHHRLHHFIMKRKRSERWIEKTNFMRVMVNDSRTSCSAVKVPESFTHPSDKTYTVLTFELGFEVSIGLESMDETRLEWVFLDKH